MKKHTETEATLDTRFKAYDWTGFSDRERLFCYEYMVDRKKGDAAIRAGFSPKTARQQATRAYTKCYDRIDEMLHDLAAPLQITTERILAEFGKVAFMTAKQFFDSNGEPIPIQNLTDEAAACVVGMKINTQESDDGDISTFKEYKLADKLDALTKLGQNLQMFTKKLVIEDKRPKVVIKDMTGRK